MNGKRNSISAGLGIPTMLTIFIILAMCILSLLTYLKAMRNEAGCEKEISMNTAYYKAACEADYLLDTFDEAYMQEKKITYTLDGDHLSFVITMEDGRYLYAEKEEDTVLVYRIAEALD